MNLFDKLSTVTNIDEYVNSFVSQSQLHEQFVDFAKNGIVAALQKITHGLDVECSAQDLINRGNRICINALDRMRKEGHFALMGNPLVEAYKAKARLEAQSEEPAEEALDSVDAMEEGFDDVNALIDSEDMGDESVEKDVKKDKSNWNNLFTTLKALELDKKLIDITLATTNTPTEIRKDVAQHICEKWSQSLVDPQYKPGQVASYAYRISRHAAFRERREIGHPVRLPGNIFRKRADGTTYATPGTIAAPLDIDELAEVIADPKSERPDSPLGYDIPEDFMEILSERQAYLLSRLVKGDELEAIAKDLNVSTRALNNESRHIAEKFAEYRREIY